MKLDDLIIRLQQATEPGTKVVIEFYRGTQQEDSDGISYDDDDWSIYTIKGNSLGYTREFVSVGDYLEQAVQNALKKMIEKSEVYL